MNKTKPVKYDVVIAGGGSAGMTLALLLGKAGLQIMVVNPNAPPALKGMTPGTRSVALMEHSLQILQRAGIQDIKQLGAALNRMRIIDDSDQAAESIWADFDAQEIGMDAYGHNIPNNILVSALYEKVKEQSNINYVTSSIVNFLPSEFNVVCELENGQEIYSSILIGADGRKSVVRERSNVAIWSKDYDQVAITCLINHSRSHNNTATEFHRPGGPFALVPMQGNQSAVVWVEFKPRGEELMALPKHSFVHALQGASKDILGGITLEKGPEMWPLQTLKAKSFTAPRVALVAEAAHVMSPITAQGLNLSLRDCADLADILIETVRAGGDIGAPTTLKRYEKARRADINGRVHGVDVMLSLVSQEKSLVKKLRRSGLRAVDAVVPIKRLAMKIGLTGKGGVK